MRSCTACGRTFKDTSGKYYCPRCQAEWHQHKRDGTLDKWRKKVDASPYRVHAPKSKIDKAFSDEWFSEFYEACKCGEKPSQSLEQRADMAGCTRATAYNRFTKWRNQRGLPFVRSRPTNFSRRLREYTKRRHYSDRMKRIIVENILENDPQMQDLAAELDIPDRYLYRWLDEYKEGKLTS